MTAACHLYAATMRFGKHRQLVHSGLDLVLLTRADDHVVSLLEELSGQSLADSCTEAMGSLASLGSECTNTILLQANLGSGVAPFEPPVMTTLKGATMS